MMKRGGCRETKKGNFFYEHAFVRKGREARGMTKREKKAFEGENQTRVVSARSLLERKV